MREEYIDRGRRERKKDTAAASVAAVEIASGREEKKRLIGLPLNCHRCAGLFISYIRFFFFF